MGYTTKFSGSLGLSRNLSVAELNEFLRIKEELDNGGRHMGSPDYYLQWVFADDKDKIYDTTIPGHCPVCRTIIDLNSGSPCSRIIWDYGEKFYNYVEWLDWLIHTFLKRWEIIASGELIWQGEDVGDVGIITVKENIISVRNLGQELKGK